MQKISNIKKKFPLAGENLDLVLFNPDHICDEYVGWLNDKEVVKYSNQRFKHHDINSCLAYYRSFECSENLFIAIHSKVQNKFIGTMPVYYSKYHDVADIGIMIGDKNYWGKGLGYEAWKLLMNFLISEVNVRKVTGGTLSCNSSMIKIMKKT